MSHRTLVAYASRAGATAEVAQTIGDLVRAHGMEVDVRSVKDVADLDGYDALIAGTPIWAGRPLPEMLEFLSDHRDGIASMPVAYYILCDTLREYTPANRQIALGYAAPLRRIKEPVGVGMFAGRRDFGKIHPMLRWFLKRVVGLAEGDWRNWDEIGTWAERVAGQVAGTESGLLRSGAA
jgi:menaquinone-dependent protoporphyrinogen oxidase